MRRSTTRLEMWLPTCPRPVLRESMSTLTTSAETSVSWSSNRSEVRLGKIMAHQAKKCKDLGTTRVVTSYARRNSVLELEATKILSL